MSDYGDDANISKDPNAITKLGTLCLKMAELSQEAEELEARLADIKHQIREYSENLIPTVMGEIGLTQIKTPGGLTIEMIEEVRASLPKDERRERALAYIRQCGDAGLIKTEFTVSFGKDADHYANIFAEALETLPGLEHAQMSREQTVNHQSLLKFLRDQIRAEAEPPLEAFGAFVQRLARVKFAKR